MKRYNFNFGIIVKSVAPLILLLLMTQTVIAQKNDIKATIITPGKVNFSYERMISAKTTLSLNYQYHDFEYAQLFNIFNSDIDYRNKGFRLMVEYRVYLSKKIRALEGFYLGPNISWGKHDLDYDYKSGNAFGIEFNPNKKYTKVSARGLGLKVGYQQKIQQAMIDIGTNVSHNSDLDISDSSARLPNFKGDIQGVYIELYLGIGYCF